MTFLLPWWHLVISWTEGEATQESDSCYTLPFSESPLLTFQRGLARKHISPWKKCGFELGQRSTY